MRNSLLHPPQKSHTLPPFPPNHHQHHLHPPKKNTQPGKRAHLLCVLVGADDGARLLVSVHSPLTTPSSTTPVRAGAFFLGGCLFGGGRGGAGKMGGHRCKRGALLAATSIQSSCS